MKAPRLTGALPALLLLALLPHTARAVGPDIPPPPARWLTDQAGVLSPAARDEIDAQLEAFERAGGRQFIVWIGRSTAPLPIEDFAVRAFAAWKVGRKGLDDGLVLFVMSDDRALRFEVGYGLEGDFPDIRAGRVINDVIVPRLQAGDWDGALRAGVAETIRALGGDAAAPADSGGEPAGRTKVKATPLQKGLVVLAVIGFIILFITNPRLALWLLWSILSSRGGGSGGGGGGWSGGGGRSGGGGASGRW